MLCELFPLTCTSRMSGAPGSLALFGEAFSHAPLAMMCGVEVSATSVTLSPFFIVMDDSTKVEAFIWTVLFVVTSLAGVAVLQAARSMTIPLASPSKMHTFLIIIGFIDEMSFLRFFVLYGYSQKCAGSCEIPPRQ